MVRQVTLELPEELVGLWDSVEDLAGEAKRALVLDALRQRRFSAGKAAELLGVSLWELHELMAKHQVPAVAMDETELRRELETARQALGGRDR